MTDIRALNEKGIELFRDFLVRSRAGERRVPLPFSVTDDRFCVLLPGNAVVEQRDFADKFDFGNYITCALSGRVPERTLRKSDAFWAWLVLFYIDAVCPADSSGRRKILSIEKYIPSGTHIKTGLDKHLLFFPWKMVSLHGDGAKWLLQGDVRQDTKVVRELANSSRRNVSATYINLARRLYFDEVHQRLRKGATTTTNKRPGSLRRLDRVVSQLDLTFDVFGIDAADLSSLIPKREFEKWLR